MCGYIMSWLIMTKLRLFGRKWGREPAEIRSRALRWRPVGEDLINPVWQSYNIPTPPPLENKPLSNYTK